MALRAVLQNDQVGSLIVENDDPIGINEVSKKMFRSDEFDGIMYDIVLDFSFIKAAREYFERAYQLAGGVDAVVNVTLYDRDNNARKWEHYYSGQANFNSRSLSEDQFKIKLEQTGLERRIVNLKATPVDLEIDHSQNGQSLPAQATKQVLYHSKKLFLQLVGTLPEETVNFTFLDIEDSGTDADPGFLTAWIQLTTSPTIDEIKQRFDYPFYPNRRFPPNLSKYFFKFDQDCELEVNLTLRSKLTVTSGISITDPVSYGFYIIHGTPGNYTAITVAEDSIPSNNGTITIDEVYSNSFSFQKGDEFYFFNKINTTLAAALPITPADFQIENFIVDGPDTLLTEINIAGLSTAPDSTAKTVLLHEAFQRVTQYVTDQADPFRSTLCGRTDIVIPGIVTPPYAEDGKAGLIGILTGNNLRGRDKKIFATLEDLLEFVNQCFCTGLGFEVIDGKIVLIVEKKSHFYNKNSKILSLGKVAPFETVTDPKGYANLIEYGYLTKLDVQQVNAIDEFNTMRQHNIPIVNTKNQLKIGTKMLTGGYPIEYQRRLSTVTEDGKHDDDNFAIVLIRDGDEFKSKKDEGYDLISGVIDSASGYNYDISPARCLQEQRELIASMLIRSNSKILTFAKGDVNYEMITQKTGESSPLAENGSVDLTNITPLWDSDLYKLLNVPFSRQQMKLVTANPYGFIDFQDRFDKTYEGFVQEIEHFPNERKADLILKKVHR